MTFTDKQLVRKEAVAFVAPYVNNLDDIMALADYIIGDSVEASEIEYVYETIEELESLPVGSHIRCLGGALGDELIRQPSGRWRFVVDGYPILGSFLDTESLTYPPYLLLNPEILGEKE